VRFLWAFLIGALAPLLGIPFSAHAADAANEKEAREHFRVGVTYLQDIEGERYEEAYAEFKAAYALSGSPKVLGNVGLCAMKLERDGEAIDAYTRYLREVNDIAPDEREQIVRDLETLKASAAKVILTLDAGPATLFDTRTPTRGSPVRNSYGPVEKTTELTLRPGHHQIAVSVGGREVGVWEVHLGAADRQSHDFRLARSAARPSRGLKVAPWIVTGVGAAVLTAGGAMGLATLKKVDNVERKCPNDACPPGSGFEADVDAARSMVRATDILLVTGAVFVAGGVTWLLLDHEAPAPAAAHRAPQVGGACDGHGCEAVVKVSF
jgi:hypothetical protein